MSGDSRPQRCAQFDDGYANPSAQSTNLLSVCLEFLLHNRLFSIKRADILLFNKRPATCRIRRTEYRRGPALAVRRLYRSKIKKASRTYILLVENGSKAYATDVTS